LALSLTQPAAAQISTTCQSRNVRPAVGVALTINSTYNNLSSGVFGAGPFRVLMVGTGSGFAARAQLFSLSRFGVAVSYGRSELGVDRKLFPGTTNQDSVGVDEHVAASEFTVGIVKHLTPMARRVCGYAAASAGVYRLAAGSAASRNGGLAGTVGLDVPFSESAAAFLELQLKGIRQWVPTPGCCQPRSRDHRERRSALQLSVVRLARPLRASSRRGSCCAGRIAGAKHLPNAWVATIGATADTTRPCLDQRGMRFRRRDQFTRRAKSGAAV
jgi:hypothetical protein